MRKKVSIGLIMIAIIIGAFVYYPFSKEPIKETDTIITDKNGEVVEPINGDNDNLGHWWTLIINTKDVIENDLSGRKSLNLLICLISLCGIR